ncbi:MAG: RnfABCDGE type electron transport complex subunit D [Treponema sp.]|jgi:electron transport complex protein RnfD|nr:RnfABCDGE type electron transport complex subunit D [Treponema sp.]
MPENYGRRYQSPQVNLSRSTNFRMWAVSFCAGLAIIQSGLGDSFSSLLLALSSVLAAVLTELFLFYRTEEIESLKDGSAVASALVFSLLLPNTMPPVYAVMGAVFAMAVVKHSFGGLGANWLNPAVGAWLFVRFSWPQAFFKALEGSPLLNGIRAGEGLLSGTAGGLDTAIRSFLNNMLFNTFGAVLPGGYIDLFQSSSPGIIADRGVLGLLLGSLFIISSQAGRTWASLAYLVVFGLVTRIAGALVPGGRFWQGDVLLYLLSGGTLAAAFILISDTVSSPKSRAGILAAAALSGFFSGLFRCLGREPYGAIYAVGLLNAFLPLIRKIENRLLYEKRMPGTAAEKRVKAKDGPA